MSFSASTDTSSMLIKKDNCSLQPELYSFRIGNDFCSLFSHNSHSMPHHLVCFCHMQSHWPFSWQSKEVCQHLRIIWRAQASGWVPTWSSVEALRSTAKICAVGDIVQDPGISIQDRIHKSNRTFANGITFFVDLDTSQFTDLGGLSDEKDLPESRQTQRAVTTSCCHTSGNPRRL
jgi:hypothetical protein